MRTLLFNPTTTIIFAALLSFSVCAGAQVKDAANRTAMAPTAEAVKFKVAEMESPARLAQPARSVAVQSGATIGASGDESRRSIYGTLAATLVLMVAIAIRRHRSGRS